MHPSFPMAFDIRMLMRTVMCEETSERKQRRNSNSIASHQYSPSQGIANHTDKRQTRPTLFEQQ